MRKNTSTYIFAKNGSFRYKIVRNKNWSCEGCDLSTLPFYDVSNSQIRKELPKIQRNLPSCEELNNLFVNVEQNDDVNDRDFDSTYYSPETKYIYRYSKDVGKVDFVEEVGSFNSFPILSMNVRSIVNRKNFTNFEAFLSNLPVKPMIIALCETWITESSMGPYSRIKGYKFVKSNRQKVPGGGVAFYIAEHLHHTKIESVSIMKEKIFESLFLNIDIDGKSIICGSLYRSPNSNDDSFIENLEYVLKECSKLNKRIIMMGDLNYNLLASNSIRVNTCIDKFFEFGMYPLVNIPTRITDTSGSVLDHVWTNIVDTPVKSAVIVNPVSDHLPVYVNMGIKTQKQDVIVEKRIFSDKNVHLFNSALTEMYISDILQLNCTNNAYNIFVKRYLEIFEKHFPKRKIKISTKEKFKKPWYTKELYHLNEVKEIQYMLYIKNKNSQQLKLNYTSCRNAYFQKVKSTKEEFYQKHLLKVKNDVKGTWNVINSVLGRSKDKQLFKLLVKGDEITNKKEIASEFNKHFSSVAKKLVKKIPVNRSRKRFDKFLGERNEKSIFLYLTNPSEISKLLRSLSEKSSYGWDDIPQKLIKSSPFNIIRVLTHIFNLSMKEGIFPEKMKIAKVIPIFKKGSTANMENYRPISLLPVFSKILERLIYIRLNKFLKKYNIIFNKQSGFREKHSTEHATAYLSSKLYNALDDRKKALCVYMDLSKAFDTINIDILIEKLHHYGIRGIANDWFKSYLKDRKQFVVIGSHQSEGLCDIIHGVPQGSILGPVLFNIYINDFWRCLTFSEAIMFADDTTLLFKGTDIDCLKDEVSNDLSSATDWLAENKLSLNVKKTKYMCFDLTRSKYPQFDFTIEGEEIKKVKSFKGLFLMKNYPGKNIYNRLFRS